MERGWIGEDSGTEIKRQGEWRSGISGHWREDENQKSGKGEDGEGRRGEYGGKVDKNGIHDEKDKRQTVER